MLNITLRQIKGKRKVTVLGFGELYDRLKEKQFPIPDDVSQPDLNSSMLPDNPEVVNTPCASISSLNTIVPGSSGLLAAMQIERLQQPPQIHGNGEL